MYDSPKVMCPEAKQGLEVQKNYFIQRIEWFKSLGARKLWTLGAWDLLIRSESPFKRGIAKPSYVCEGAPKMAPMDEMGWDLCRFQKYII